MPSGEVFVDAGAWIALSDRRDTHHAEAVAIQRRLLREHARLVTTNLVLGEAHIAIRRLGGFDPALRFLVSLRESARLLRIYADEALETEAEQLLRRYDVHDLSLADAVSFAVMTSRGISDAFGFDRHFATAGFSLVRADK